MISLRPLPGSIDIAGVQAFPDPFAEKLRSREPAPLVRHPAVELARDPPAWPDPRAGEAGIRSIDPNSSGVDSMKCVGSGCCPFAVEVGFCGGDDFGAPNLGVERRRKEKAVKKGCGKE